MLWRGCLGMKVEGGWRNRNQEGTVIISKTNTMN
jgi:hypothetical protein